MGRDAPAAGGGLALTRIVVADDHSIVLEGLVALLQGEPGMQVVGQATNGRQALEEVRRGRPDVALLDISMPEMSGLEITRQLTDEMPDVRTLILTMHDEDALLLRGTAGWRIRIRAEGRGQGGDPVRDRRRSERRRLHPSATGEGPRARGAAATRAGRFGHVGAADRARARRPPPDRGRVHEQRDRRPA